MPQPVQRQLGVADSLQVTPQKRRMIGEPGLHAHHTCSSQPSQPHILICNHPRRYLGHNGGRRRLEDQEMRVQCIETRFPDSFDLLMKRVPRQADGARNKGNMMAELGGAPE